MSAEALVATRAAGLAQLQAVLPRLGRAYAAGRNLDHGPGRPQAVSGLSPWIRRRLVTEEEVARAAVAAHGGAADKFVEEVIWRGYFKGWLERRPQVWSNYLRGRDADLERLARDAKLQARVAAAEAGRTGLACFDAFAQELVATGTLHNHARMWFASLWIFTLGLPWRLGADFFLRHLLDGDPASNTLGWRWVAGLHTRGKVYAATAANIAQYSGGRFAPRPEDIVTPAHGLEAEEPGGWPALQPLRALIAPQRDVPSLWLITEEDCGLTGLFPDSFAWRGAATLSASQLRSPRPVASRVATFEAAALRDAATRTGFPATELTANDPAALVACARDAGATQIVTAEVPQGPLRDWLTAAAPALAAAGITLAEWRRPWDATLWPFATAGFFKVRERIPRLLAEMRVA
ncbi:FAD-binding domain-containing protein [Bradyrhizobium sp. STM 3809]|uniref:FAD-binding domain-containing protein n=1 Tax=Bradyrhizobium sp. STM 3809 TaxID=551936 RepID=UPI0002408E62|nr:FAD-binding domain-containing protein [Bradyrhizobium sp. STM 3809]CCE01126.1 putative Deoxyribodipyrimidine photo-lyase [Bradyrhizobium sp. STM 3809]